MSSSALPLLAVAAAALLLKRKSVSEDVDRIVSEADQIAKGQRDAFSQPHTKQAALKAAKKIAKLPSVQPVNGASKKDVVAPLEEKMRVAIAQQGATLKAARERAERAAAEAAVKQYERDTKAAAPPKPAPTPAPAPPPPAPPPVPGGYDPVLARRSAKGVAAAIRSRGYSYPRAQLRAFQLAAGIEPDGIYGGATRGALIYYGAANPPRALFKPTQTKPYSPPA